MRWLVKWLDLGYILEIDPSKLTNESDDDNATRRMVLTFTEVEEVRR